MEGVRPYTGGIQGDPYPTEANLETKSNGAGGESRDRSEPGDGQRHPDPAAPGRTSPQPGDGPTPEGPASKASEPDPGGPHNAVGGTIGGSDNGEGSSGNPGSASQNGDSSADETGHKRSSGSEADSVRLKGTREQREFLDERARTMPERWLFLHLLHSHRHGGDLYSASDRGGLPFHPIYCRFIEFELGGPRCTQEVWDGSSLIDVWEGGAYFPDEGLSREMRAEPEVLEQWLDLGVTGPKRWWLHTPRPQRTSPDTADGTRVTNDNGRSFPEPIGGALRALKEARHPFRIEAVREAIEALSGAETREERAVLCNLRSQLEVIERQYDPDSGTLQNAYEVQPLSGRLQFVGGGPQGLHRAVKQRAYDIDGAYNYDIESCHTEALRHLAEDLQGIGVRIDTKPLDQYLEKGGKNRVAKEKELPRSLVKATEHAVKFGAALPVNMDHARRIAHEIGRMPKVAKLAEKQTASPDKALEELREAFQALRQTIGRMSQALVKEYFEAHKQPGGPDGYCVKNACGIPFRPDEYEEGHKRQTKAMAWYLQGLEAAYIHSVTALSKEYGYEAFANEHDGLLTKGLVPEEAKERARQQSGFARANLVQKPLASDEEVEEIYGSSGGKSPGPEDFFEVIRAKPDLGLLIIETDADYVCQIQGIGDENGLDRLFACEVGDGRYIVAGGPGSVIELGFNGNRSNQYFEADRFVTETAPLSAGQAWRKAASLDGGGSAPIEEARKGKVESLDLSSTKIEKLKTQIAATASGS